MRCETAFRSGSRCIWAHSCRYWCGGLYYDQWRPSDEARKQRSAEVFLDHVSQGLSAIRPVNVQDATHAVFRVLNHHVDPHQIQKVRQALPENIRVMWPGGGQTGRFEPAA
jgi:uncharacterized protein (DUF2267 family)